MGEVKSLFHDEPGEPSGTDLTAFHQLASDMDGDWAMITDLTYKFIDDTRTRTENIVKSFASQSFDEVKQMAHSMKSSAAAFGAFRFASLCAKLESLSPSELAIVAPVLGTQLSDEFTVVKDQLIAELESHRGQTAA